MATFSMSDADNYGNQSNGGSFFSLKDDKDTAQVRFLYETIDDVKGYAVHRVAVGDKERYVNCLRDYRDPVDVCPFCAAQLKVQAKLFLNLYNEDAKECQIWERGKSYFSRIASLANRYNPLHNEVVEIERNGKKGDLKTEYQFYPIDNSEVSLDDFDIPNPLGTIILDKNADEMNEYLETGSFPDTTTEVSNARSEMRDDRQVTRRTPSTAGPRRSF